MRKLHAFLLSSFAATFLFAGASSAAQLPADLAAPMGTSQLKAANEPDPIVREAEQALEAAQEGGQSTVQLPPILAAAAAGNYAFATTTTASLVDMSTGTTTLVAADQDDTASAVTLIGFDFYFQGSRQDRFSVNSNGTLRFGATTVGNTLYDPLAQAGQSLITAYGADQRTHIGNGKVHFKVLGSAPNRELSIEWLNMQADFNAGGTADLTYQVHLFETTGAIEFVYGSMSMSANGAPDANSQSPQFGFSSNNLGGTVGSITAAQSGTPAPTFNGVASAPANNLYAAGIIPVLTSAADGSRRSFTFTPPSVNPPGAPLTFTAVSAASVTLNWTDSSNEVGYGIYVSTDGGSTYTFIGAAAQDATSFTANGLSGGVNYMWLVAASSEGAVASIGGTQGTPPPTPNTSVTTGLWGNPTTWSTGSVPTSSDAVTISAGTIVGIDVAAVAYSLTVAGGGVLQFEQTTARTLTVSTDVAVQNGGTLRSNAAGTQTGHVLSVAGNLTNSGTLDFSTNADTAGAGITFTGTGNNTFGGAGATTDVRTVTINKGTTNASVLELNPSSFTVRGVTTDTVVGGWLVLTNGTLKLSGTFAGTSRVFSAAAYSIGATQGFWLNNPNYVVAGQAGSATLAGLLHVSQGTFNIGTATGNSMGFSTGSTIIVDGGAVNAAGRIGVTAAANAISYTQSGGTITACTIGNASATLGSFDLGTSLNSAIAISGGTIVVQINATAIDYRNQAGGGITGVTAGTLQLGNAASGAAKTFNLRGVLPNLLVSNTSAGHTGTMSTTLANYNNIGLNITVASGATFNTGNVLFLMSGTTLTNNGTFTASGASSNFIWFDNGQGPQTYTGTGVTTAPVTTTSVQTGLTLTFTSTNPFIANRVNLFSGGLVNANKITLGTGAATTGVVQIGNTTTPTAAGTFDSAPTFNLGTGGQIISYLRTGGSRVTGPEINPGRTLTNVTYDDNDPAHTLTLTGGDLLVTGATTLTNGRVITGSNTLAIGAAGTVARTNGYVEGNFRKTLAAAASKTFEVGTANGFSPVVFNATAGTFPADVTIAAIQTPAPGIQPLTDVITRFWNVTATGVTADMTFSYLDPTDIPGTVTEANMHVLHQGVANANDYSDAGGTINTAANTATVTGVTSFSTWTLGTASADLGVTIDDGVATATAGGNVTYTIVATNGGAVGNAAVLVSDSFQPELTCSTTCSGANGGTCTAGPFAGDINDSANIPSGGSVTYTASCAISPTATGSLSNTAHVFPNAVTDNNLGNNSATDIDGLGGVADLAITKTDGVTTATPGGSVTYTITASNAGPSAALGTTVADTFPASLTCTWTCTGAGGGTCTASGSGNINDTVNLPVGSSTTYTASCTISAAATGTLSNTATVGSSSVSDPTPGNNSATDTDMLAPNADLAITKTDGVTTATPGGSVTYTITSSNSGPSNATGATVADTFPASLTCTWTCVGAGGGTCTAAGSGNINDVVNLPSGGSVTHTASCTISPAATGTLSNTAVVSAPGGVTDPTPGNNSATDSDTLNAQADLAITKTDGVTSVAPGGSTTYTITASNAGPSNAAGATVADTFPASETCTWTCTGAGGGTCTASGSGNINDTVNLPSGGSTTYTASCSISAAATGTISNTATVAAPGGVTDPTPGNNSATDTDTLAQAADLSITATDGVTTATPGLGVTYTIVASNAGPSDASGATVADTFPASETCTWTCAGAGGATCAASGSGNINQSVNLPNGSSATFTATCSIAASASGTLSNTATVTAPASVNDPTPGNNSATDTDTLVRSAVLTVTAGDGRTHARYGQTLNYLLTISNAGPSDASDIGISESFSPDFAVQGARWVCIGAFGGASCTASGTGPLTDSNIVLPVSHSLTWLVSVSTLVNPADDFADNLFRVTTAADANSPFLRLDTDFFVIFRDGFEPGLGDGTGDIAPPMIDGQAPVLTRLSNPLSAGQSLGFDLPAGVGTQAVDTLVSAHAIDGTGFRVERLNLEATPQLRIVAIDVLGAERTSAWIKAAASGHVVLGLVDDGGTAALLETASGEATLRLSIATEEVYQVQAVGSGAAIVH
jgi:uncharacterized repeat protein (TIGR01451 family)